MRATPPYMCSSPPGDSVVGRHEECACGSLHAQLGIFLLVCFSKSWSRNIKCFIRTTYLENRILFWISKCICGQRLPSFTWLLFLFHSVVQFLYRTSGIFASLNISAFIGIRIFELALFCFLLTILFMKAANILCILPKMTVLLLVLVLCFFMVISNYKIFSKASYWAKEIVIKTEAGPLLVCPEVDCFVMSWDLQWWFSGLF